MGSSSAVNLIAGNLSVTVIFLVFGEPLSADLSSSPHAACEAWPAHGPKPRHGVNWFDQLSEFHQIF